MGVAGDPPPRTRVHLLGGLEVSVVGLRATFRSPTSPLALAALALLRRPVPRARLAALLAEWSGAPVVPIALTAVTAELARVLGPDLVVDDHTLGLRFGPSLWIDTELLTAAADPSTPASAGDLLRALHLYRGDLLAGVDVRDEGELAALVDERRAELRGWAVEVARRLARRARRGPVALEAVARLGELAPCSEVDCRLAIKVLARSGRALEALARSDELARRCAAGGAPAPGPLVGRLAGHVDTAERRRLRRRHPRLPVPDTPTIGRRAELERVVALATDGMTSVVTLTGPGGVGKSRLAVEAAMRVAERRGAQAAAIRFDGAGPVDPLATTARAFGLDVPAGLSTVPELAAVLGDAPRVLVLDVEAGSGGSGLHDVARIAARCGSLTVLVASRSSLRVPGERVVPVRPLSVPTDGASLDEVATSPAVRLFARLVGDPALVVDPVRAPAVADVCRELDGVPFAIEHAARGWATVAPLRARPPAAGSGAPTGLSTDASSAALTALARSTIGPLDDDERRVAEVLAHAPGGADLALVARAAQLPERRCAAVLRHLVDVHVADSVTGLRGRATRYSVPAATAAFLLDSAEPGGRAGDTGHRLRGAVVERLGPGGFDFGTATEAQLAALAGDHANLVAVLSGAVASGERATAVRLAAALGWFWQVSGNVPAGTWWVTRVLAMDPAAGTAPDPVEGQLLLAAAVLALRRNAGGEARTHLLAARQHFDATGEKLGLANVELLEAVVSLFGPSAPADARRVTSSLEATGEHFAALADAAGVSRTLHTVALAHALAGEHGRAIDLAGAVAALASGQGNRRIAALAHSVVALAALFDGDARRAVGAARAALSGAWSLRDLVVVRYALAVLPAALVAADPRSAATAVLLGAAATDLDGQLGVPTPASCRDHLATIVLDAEGTLDRPTLRALRRDAARLGLDGAVEVALASGG